MAKTIDDSFFQATSTDVPSPQEALEPLSKDEFTRLVHRVRNPDPSNYTERFIDGYTKDRVELFSRLRTPQSCHKSPKQ